MKPIALVVDDNPVNRQVLGAMLGRSATVRMASDGVEALEQIEREEPDIMFLDIMMPRLDGFGVIDALERSNRDDLITRTVVVTARVNDDTEHRVCASGVAGFMAKPVMLPEVIDTFTSVTGRSGSQGEAVIPA